MEASAAVTLYVTGLVKSLGVVPLTCAVFPTVTEEPVVVKLAPLAAITGRVVDGDGNPVAGASVRPDVLPGGDYALSLGQVATDSDGRFRILGIPTGCDYPLAVETSAPLKERRFAFHNRAAVKPRETTDVGEIKFGRD